MMKQHWVTEHVWHLWQGPRTLRWYQPEISLMHLEFTLQLKILLFRTLLDENII